MPIVKQLIARGNFRRGDAVALRFGLAQLAAAWRTVGGRATPAARSARLAAGRRAERRRIKVGYDLDAKGYPRGKKRRRASTRSARCPELMDWNRCLYRRIIPASTAEVCPARAAEGARIKRRLRARSVRRAL